MSAIIYVALFWLNKTRKRAKSEKSKPLRKLKAKKANRHSMYNVVRINLNAGNLKVGAARFLNILSSQNSECNHLKSSSMHVGTDSVKFLYRFRPFNSKLCVNFYFDTRHGRLRSGLLQSTYPFRERRCQICITSNHRYSSYFF